MIQAKGYKTSGQGKPLVLLHSSLSSAAQWGHLVGLLKQNHLCINIDLLCYGDAPTVSDPSSYTLKDETDRLIEIINQQIGDAPFAIVGHSFGGAVALRMANLMAERITNMVLYEPVAFHLIKQHKEAFADIYDVSSKLNAMSDEMAARSFVDYWNYPGFYDEKPRKIRQLFNSQISKVKLDFKGLMAEEYEISDLKLEHCPALIIAGKQSPLSSQTIASRLAQHLPNVQYQQFNGGHMAPIQDAKAVAEIIAGYFSAATAASL